MEQWLEYEHWLHEAETEQQFSVCNLDDAAGWCGWWQWWASHSDSVVHEAMPNMGPAQADFHV
jgi:chitodextrinase